MSQPHAIDGATVHSANVLSEFVRWYYSTQPRAILALYRRYARAFGESFSLMFMLKTLFQPWKNITDDYPHRGFNVEQILQTFFLNITSRAIGLIVRFVALLTGIIIQIGLLVGFATYAFVWMFFPFIVALLVPLLIVAYS